MNLTSACYNLFWILRLTGLKEHGEKTLCTRDSMIPPSTLGNRVSIMERSAPASLLITWKEKDEYKDRGRGRYQLVGKSIKNMLAIFLRLLILLAIHKLKQKLFLCSEHCFTGSILAGRVKVFFISDRDRGDIAIFWEKNILVHNLPPNSTCAPLGTPNKYSS